MQDRSVRHIVTGKHPRVTAVVPWTSEGGRVLVGAEIRIDLHPATRLTGERVPTLSSRHTTHPPERQTSTGFALYSADKVSQLRTLVELRSARVVHIAPHGDNVEITKAELLGPSSENLDAYKNDPGY